MAWRRLGDKPLSEAMMVSLPTHIYVTRPQWVNLQLALDKYYRGGISDVLSNQQMINMYRKTLHYFNTLAVWRYDLKLIFPLEKDYYRMNQEAKIYGRLIDVGITRILKR